MGKVATRKLTEEDLKKIEQWEAEGKVKVPKAVKEAEAKRKLEKLDSEEAAKKILETVEGGPKTVEIEELKELEERKNEKPKAKKAEKPKAEKPKDEKKVVNMEGTLTTKDVAAMVGTTPRALRRVLRAKWYNDGVHTNYRWTQDDPVLKEIIEYYKKEGQKEAK